MIEKRLLHRLPACVRWLIADRKGWALPVTGLAMFTLIAVIVVVLDLGRAALVRGVLADATHKAAIAAAWRAGQDSQIEHAHQVLMANFPEGRFRTGERAVDIVIDAGADGSETVTIFATVDVPTIALGLVSERPIVARARSVVMRDAGEAPRAVFPGPESR